MSSWDKKLNSEPEVERRFASHPNFSLNASIDFSVHGLTYDANGNIQTMNQKGWLPGGSVTIDSLLYT